MLRSSRLRRLRPVQELLPVRVLRQEPERLRVLRQVPERLRVLRQVPERLWERQEPELPLSRVIQQ